MRWNPSGTVLNEFCNILIVAILLGTLCGREKCRSTTSTLSRSKHLKGRSKKSPQFEKSKLLSDLIHPLYTSLLDS
ncbi:unnamed protein product [Rhizophagus irregularis]|nr:unnamed protein product [Rhizophagus irregularis]